MPHKTLDEFFKPRMDVGNALNRLQDLVTTPVVSERHGYSNTDGARLYNNGATEAITYTAQITDAFAIADEGNENMVTLIWNKENDTTFDGGTSELVKTAKTFST